MAPRGDVLAAEGVAAAPVAGAQVDPAFLSEAEFIWLVGSVCGFHQRVFDENLLRQRFAPPYTVAQVCAALHELGLEIDVLPQAASDLLAAFAAGEVVAFAWLEESAPASAVLIVRYSADGVRLYPALAATPVALSLAQFGRGLASSVFVVRRAGADPVDIDLDRTPPAFGFRWFVPELLRHRRIWRDVIAGSAAIQLLALGVPLMTQAIIDKVIVHRTESTLIALAFGLVLFLVFSAGLTWIRQRLILHTGVRVDAVLGAKVFRHLIQLPPRYFMQRPTGVITARLHGIETIREFLASAAISVLLDLPFLSLCLAVMFSYSVALTLVVVGFIGLIAAMSLVAAPRFQQRLAREFSLGARNQGFVTEYVAGIETVKSLQMERVLEARYGDYLSAYLQAGYATRLTANSYAVAASTIEQAMTLAILVCGAYVVMTPAATSAQAFTLGMLVAFQMFAARLSQPVMKLVGLWQQFQQARLAVARLGDLMDASAEPYRLAPERARNPHPGGLPVLEARGLAFRYADGLPYLYRDLNFVIRAGECVAITGRSGCGKSTLARLVQGFCQPTEGSVVVGGVDARNLAANELRAMFGVVPQETVLFSGTLLDNLLLANPFAGFDDVVTACRMAGIHSVIEALPRGYRTEVGERGAGLSGGQRQRVAIARALLKQPGVLIFDEATSNLDAQTAYEFARTIDALRGRVTLLFIAHAPITGLTFDREIRLDAGASAKVHPA